MRGGDPIEGRDFVAFPGEPPRLPVVNRASDLDPAPPHPVARCFVKTELAFYRWEDGRWTQETRDA